MMFNLIRNEHIKIFYKKGNQVLVLIFAIGCLLLALMTKNILSSSGDNESFADYFVFSTNFLFLLQFVSVIIAGSIVANEYDWGTIKFLLIRPAQRSKVLLSKYLTVLLVGVYLLVGYAIFAFLYGFVFFGISDFAGDFDNVRNIFLRYMTTFVEISVMSTFAFTLSTVFRSSVIATGTSIFLILTGRTFVEVLAHYQISWGKYILFANTNLTQFFSGNRPLFREMTFTGSIITLCIYLGVFIAASWYAFTKRDVAN
ncbi:ABC transporter permease [Bacillus sp. Marseille-Q3570]|uniref:ABC transporter permease n=1 Tax=Bacillus sp. Marseille-Q3570 TaxID=2963522 RepID=UPI0021B7583B|nr:ABC transporter permease [Bacillus sp. Marseille-Q3570]